MRQPLISIIIPLYNRGLLIKETLDSVCQQKYSNWECIIIDDGSTDNGPRIVQEFCKKDSRFHFYNRPTQRVKGAAACRNFGLEQAGGELIQFLDSDDLLAANKLSAQLKKYNENSRDLLTCKWGGFTKISDLKSRFKYNYQSYRDFKKGIRLLNTFGLFNEYFPVHVYLTPVRLIKLAGQWNEQLNNNDDAEYFTRVILKANRIIFTPGARVYYRYNSEDKLSDIDTDDKVKSYKLSIQLIAREIKENSRFNYNFYVNRAKNNLYKSIKSNSEFEEGKIEEGKDYDLFPFSILKKVIEKFN